MRVLVTGSTGLIGKRLGVELVRRGHSLVCLVRDVERARAQLPFPAELVAWGSSETLKDIDAVVHLAGESIGARRWSAEQKARIVESRTKTTADLLARVQRGEGRHPNVLVSASAIGYYGDRGEEWLMEESAPGQGFLSETCQAWEGAIFKALPEIPRVVALRTGIVLSREGGALAAMLPLFKNFVGGRLGPGSQWMSWIHIDDLVQLYCFALESNELSGPVNAVAPHPTTNAEFTRVLAQQLKVPALFPAPAFALKLALGEMSDLLLESQRVRERVSSRGFRFRHERLDGALHAILKDVEKARGVFCHEHLSEQWLPLPVESVFAYLTDARNLEKITPPEYGLKVNQVSTVRLREGSTIDYELKCYGHTVACRTLVLDWLENQRYSSTQQRGPFRFWFHTHRFERLGGGTLISDRVIYRCRGGILGSLAAQGSVSKRLAKIFSFRRRRVTENLVNGPARRAS